MSCCLDLPARSVQQFEPHMNFIPETYERQTVYVEPLVSSYFVCLLTPTSFHVHLPPSTLKSCCSAYTCFLFPTTVPESIPFPQCLRIHSLDFSVFSSLSAVSFLYFYWNIVNAGRPWKVRSDVGLVRLLWLKSQLHVMYTSGAHDVMFCT